MFTGVDIETLRQPQQHRFRNPDDVERLKPIHGNLDKRATEALKYLVEVRHTITIDVSNYLSFRHFEVMQFIVELKHRRLPIRKLNRKLLM
jgi:hypothetical protein